MKIVLLNEERISTKILPSEVGGLFKIVDSVNGRDETILNITQSTKDNSAWNVKSTKYSSLVDGEEIVDSLDINYNETYFVNIAGKDEMSFLITESISDEQNTFVKYQVKENSIITIGKNANSDILLSNKFASKNHATIQMSNGRMSLTDSSTNGTYVNNLKVKGKTLLRNGDVIYILGVMIVVSSNYIAINSFRDDVNVQHNKLENVSLETNEKRESLFENETTFFSPSPKFYQEFDEVEITIDSPPANQNPEGTPMILMIGPSITMGMSSMFMAAFSVQGALNSGRGISSALPSLSMAFFMLLGMVMWPVLLRKYEKKQKMIKEAIRQEKYLLYLDKKRDEIQETIISQEKQLRRNSFSVGGSVRMIDELSHELWSVEKTDNEFMSCSLGRADLDSKIKLKFSEKKFTIVEDNLQDALYELASQDLKIKNVPLNYSLVDSPLLGVYGKEKDLINYFRRILIQLVATCSYEDLKIVVLLNEDQLKDMQYVKWLPHVFEKDSSLRFLCTDDLGTKSVSSYLQNVFEYRQSISESELKEQRENYLIVTFDKELEKRFSVISKVINDIKNKERYLGFSVLSFKEKYSQIKREFNSVIELKSDSGSLLDGRDKKKGIIDFTFNTVTPNLLSMSKKLLNTKLDSFDSEFELPRSLSFLDMFEAAKVDHLNLQSRWENSDPVSSLKAQIGVTSLGDKSYLDLHEKSHGPHGLVAGSTGSGKSEFIITYILSMAINYSPEDVSFILIDFKGGGMADTFDRLPHIAGKITNLDGNEMKRSLLSIESELRRRQRIFAQASKDLNVSNIDIYGYQKLYKEGRVKNPLSHLIIISDEFAELKAQQPEFMEKLISAARIGRSLGVHLILATQKPSGVVDDQIWSNSRFKVCLKVQDKSDSMDMLKRPDAANLSDVGRYYFQVGYNEIFDLGQSAYSGEMYEAKETFSKNAYKRVSCVNNSGQVLSGTTYPKKMKSKHSKKQIDAIVDHIDEICSNSKVVSQKIWLNKLKQMILLECVNEELVQSQTHLNPLLGMVDDPQNQNQFPLTVPFTDQGNVVVFGSGGTGVEMFVKTLLYSMFRKYSAKYLSSYVIDLGSERLRAFKGVEQISDFIGSADELKVPKLFAKINKTFIERRQKLSDLSLSFEEYNKSNDDVMENIVIVINNYSSFTELFENEVEWVYRLSREGVKYGIYFLITAPSSGAVRYRTLQNFNQIFTLRFNDDNEYMNILGRTNGLTPEEINGRGLLKFNNTILEYQVCSIAPSESAERIAINELKVSNKKEFDRSIKVMPETIKLSHYEDEISLNNGVLVGLSDQEVFPAFISFENKVVTNIVDDGNNLTLRKSIINQLSSKYETVLYDSFGLGCDVKTFEDSKAFTEHFFSLVLERNNAFKTALEQGKSETFDQVFVVINSISELSRELFDLEVRLMLAMNKNEIDYNIKVIIFDNSNTFYVEKNNDYFKKHCKEKISMFVGDTLRANNELCAAKLSEDQLYQPTSPAFAHIVQDNEVIKVKMVEEI